MSPLTVVLSTPSAPSLHPGDTATTRGWLIGQGNPNDLHTFLYDNRWTYVIDADGGLHAASPCTRVYLGYQPDNPHADTWIVSVDGTARDSGWRARFNRHTPVEIVLAVLRTLVEHPGR